MRGPAPIRCKPQSSYIFLLKSGLQNVRLTSFLYSGSSWSPISCYSFHQSTNWLHSRIVGAVLFTSLLSLVHLPFQLLPSSHLSCCSFPQDGGGCVIKLSEPLLKFRPPKDLKETLLHEMIHAKIFLTSAVRDHEDHGPQFQVTPETSLTYLSLVKHMQLIQSECPFSRVVSLEHSCSAHSSCVLSEERAFQEPSHSVPPKSPSSCGGTSCRCWGPAVSVQTGMLAEHL